MALEAGTSPSLSSSPCVTVIPLSATGSGTGTGTVAATGRDSPVVFAPNNEAEEWSREWASVLARDLIDGPVIEIASDAKVEQACDLLLSQDVSCLAVKDLSLAPGKPCYMGLLDFADVNAFLTLAATQHALTNEELNSNPLMAEIVKAGKGDGVPVRLISNLSEKNPLEILPDTATVVDLLKVFSQGSHRVLISKIRSGDDNDHEVEYAGFVSDRALLSFFHAHAQISPPLARFASNSLHNLALPSINLRAAVVSCPASSSVREAMTLMSTQGVSNVAVVEDGPPSLPSTLLSAVSVTDIGKLVLPSESKQVLQLTLQQFVARIKGPDGTTDGVDKYPVYSVSVVSSLHYTMEKILATNAHRVFISEEIGPSPGSSPTTATMKYSTQLRGVVSIVDILALFARLAGLPDVDPSRMQRHRRASSARSVSPEVDR